MRTGRPSPGLAALLIDYPGAPETHVLHWMTSSLTLGELTTAARVLAAVLGPVVW
jgi:hypothetical protein